LAVGARAPVALALAVAVEGVHLGDGHPEDALHGVGDLGLRGRRVDAEGVDAVLEERVALLGDDRFDDDLAGVLHSPSSVVSAAASSTGCPAAAGVADWPPG